MSDLQKKKRTKQENKESTKSTDVVDTTIDSTDDIPLVFDIDNEPRKHYLHSFDNMKRPENKRMYVITKIISSRERDRIRRDATVIAKKSGYEYDSQEWNSVFVDAMFELQYTTRIVEIGNIFFNISGTPKEITDIKELFGIKSMIAVTLSEEIKKIVDDNESPVPEKN